MVYRVEYINAKVFRKLQEKIPREPKWFKALDTREQVCEFSSHQRIRTAAVVAAIFFEANARQAKQICQYQHAKSLWLLLSLEKTKQLALPNQMIFDGLPEHFHQKLSDEVHEQVMTFLQPLSLERLEILLELMFECIFLVISVPQNQVDEDYVDAKEKKFKDCLLALMIEEEVELPGGLMFSLMMFCPNSLWPPGHLLISVWKRKRDKDIN